MCIRTAADKTCTIRDFLALFDGGKERKAHMWPPHSITGQKEDPVQLGTFSISPGWRHSTVPIISMCVLNHYMLNLYSTYACRRWRLTPSGCWCGGPVADPHRVRTGWRHGKIWTLTESSWGQWNPLPADIRSDESLLSSHSCWALKRKVCFKWLKNIYIYISFTKNAATQSQI